MDPFTAIFLICSVAAACVSFYLLGRTAGKRSQDEQTMRNYRANPTGHLEWLETRANLERNREFAED